MHLSAFGLAEPPEPWSDAEGRYFADVEQWTDTEGAYGTITSSIRLY